MGHHLRFLWFLLVASFSCQLILARSEVTREFEISEGVPIGTSIGFIGEQVSGSFQPPPPYLIVPVPGSSVDSDLIIDQSNGEIRTKIQLDRETRDFYSLVAIPINGENIRVIIRVKDENDHAPQFPSESMSVEFPENTPGDVKRTLQPAKDKDLGIYNTQRYSISAGNVNNAFRLSSHRERDGVLYLDLQVNGFLDRETTPFYNLVIDAFDGGVPPLKGSMTVNVTIQDVNDNQPIFNQSRYFATVPENATVGTSVLQVCATDTDAGPNGQIFYSINRRQTDKDSIFKIDKNTGVISVNRPLDFESKEVHELVVVARDNGVQPLETTVFVSITVIDVNDNQPVISLIFLTDDATPKVSEGAKPGEFVARISVHDPDSKQEYSNVNVTLEGGGGHFGLTTRNGVVYLVIVAQLLDRELMPNYTLSVVATDRGSPPLNTSCTFHLNVLDINDNPPNFTDEVYRFSIEENNEPGASIGRVTALDRDIGENGSIRYSLQPLHPTFQIDSTTGIISATTSLDREKQSAYKLQVIAFDQGIPQKQTEAVVHINVSDVNDNAPSQIEPGDDILVVREEQPGGIEVTRVVATDPDNGLNATFTFSLVNDGYSDTEDFTIDANTGIIRTKNVLNHEKKPFYNLGVVVKDKGIPPLETVQNYRVQILEINDHRPTPTRSKFNFKLYENATIGQLVGTVTATDEDNEVDSRKFTYVIARGNIHDTFDVDKTTGALLVAKQIKYEVTSHYLLQVQALSSGDVPSSAANYVSVDIDILDVNNNSPHFLQGDPIEIHVAENTRVGSVVWNFTAMDADDGLNGIVHYEILQQYPEETFRINTLTGTMYLQATLDYETQSSYMVVVMATDQALNPLERLNSTTTAHIFVDDQNDNIPRFLSSQKISVYEVEPSNSVLHTVIAMDLDSGENGRITYSIISGNEAGYFLLNRDSGQLSLLKSLDREEFDYFSLNVTASDQGSPRNVATQLLQVTLENVNNNPPQFVYRKYEARVQENSLIGTEVIKVTAFDRHQSPNNTFVYVIPEGMADGKFAIHPSTGSISVAGLIDREIQSSYVVTVYVHDGNYMSLFDTTTVNISVEDENDNPPALFDTCSDLYVPENSDLGVIHTFTAVDPDTGRNGEVTFSIAAGNADNIFSVDVHTGKLTSRPLDRERRSQYQLLVVAQDQGLPVQRTFCNITIYVQDVNDNSPNFFLTKYSASISENIPVGTTVLTVEASDADVGINSAIKYSLNNESHWHFTIDNTTGAIVTAGPLDREKIRDYTFEVAATDGGLYDSRSSKTLVHIKLTDHNDNAPTISQNPVQIEIPPFTKPGQKIAQVMATDLDEGINADITYSIENPETKFRVQPQTGIITPAISLSAERGRIFQLRVVAKDQGIPSLSSTALVVIQVGDVPLSNTLRFQESHYEDQIPENSPPGTEMVQVTALRNDGRRQRILYSIVGGNEDNIFEMISTTGLLKIKDQTNLDRERRSKYSLVVSAKTDGPTPLYAHVLVHVNVTDENDNIPRFTQDSYVASVWEGNNKGTFVTQVTATDNDEGSNANLIYHIVDGNHDNAFIIEPPFSGIVKTNIVLDREIQDKYRLTIIATDEGSPQMTGTCLLQINVIDVNDNQPVAPHSVVNISESLPMGSLVTTMVANDVDTNPSLVYSFTEMGNPNGTFSIEKYSGRVTLSKPLDYESLKTHVAQIQVSDTVHTAYTNLTIHVLDANDNSPQFPSNIFHVTMSDDTKPGSQVIQVTATDKDSNQNALIKYALRASKDGKSKGARGFWIDENTGIVFTNATIPYQHENPFVQMTIIASDSGKPKRSTKATLWIEVRPSESDLLRLTQNKYTATISEAVKPGTLVTKLNVEYDKKLSKNLHFHYRIASGNAKEYFTITSHTGEILVARQLDREDQKLFKLQVTADCVNMAKCSAVAEVIITITDVNDNPPRFNQTEFKVSVSENKPIGSTIFKIYAIDSDMQNDSIRFDITSGNDASVFELHPRTGEILLLQPLDFDTVPVYRFVVRAQDTKSVGRLWSLAVVQVEVQDENDNAPYFSYPLYLEFVGENEPIGTPVFTARATDLDRGIYGKLNYSIIEGDIKEFRVDPSTGAVTTATVFNYEYKDSYYFTLRANDIGGQSATVKVQVGIESRDEYPPQFTHKTYKFIIPINAPPGYVVGRVDATDQDKGWDGVIVYQLRHQSNHFRLNKTTGTLILRQALSSDFNTSVVIMANSGRPGSKSTATFAEISVGAPSEELEMASSSSVADWVVGLLVTSLLLLFLCCTVFVVLHLRQKKQAKNDKSETYNNSAFDTLEYAQSTMLANNSRPNSVYSPQYSDLADLTVNDRRRVNNTVSELSDQSHSASSGRGSAEDGEEVEDEEIRMINEGSLAQQKLRDSIGMPDIGIHGDYDNMSQSSAKNTQEYLARLGIRPKMSDEHPVSHVVHSGAHTHNEWTRPVGPDALDSIHLFGDEGGGEGDGMDISTLIYAQIPDDINNESEIMETSSRINLNSAHQPSMNGSLSSIVHSEEELTGSYNWDYLLDWGPQYQPLAHVFSEIARLKDDVADSPEPHYSGIHARHSTPNNQPSGKGDCPPPSYVNASPRRVNNAAGGRPGHMPPLPLLPRSPISHDSTFASGPMSPSFSPALSPLANPSPSMSPLGGV
ncbi:unnamed protein product [Allacma fusca]|uniref:Cadherin domain-containing protein n=1 Tax=Allacma fusca TaxID=39272 RepID=A0A8J2PPF0_9HEXA|nr:unnamed protein product [Allacma fusca]